MSNQTVWSDEGGEYQPEPGADQSADPGNVDPQQAGEVTANAEDTRPVNIEFNRDPFRRRIAIPHRGLLYKAYRAVKERFTPPPPTAEEAAEMSEAQRLKELGTVLRAEAQDAMLIMSNALARMGYCYRRITADGTIDVRKRVTFDFISMQEDAIWFHIDTRRLPFGVSLDDLKKEEVINDLSYSVGHRVGVRHDPEAGIWYIVERASGRMGIPSHVKLAEMWERMPQTATALTVPVGMTNNRKLIYDSIADWPHGLVAGSTQMGKSNMLNVILCTLIRRNSPDRLQLCLVDLKEGLEFSFYEGIPHLLPITDIAPKGIVYDRENVLPMLTWVIAEGRRRMRVIGDAGHKEISKYNAYRKGRQMPRMVVVIDEWADVRLSADGKQAEEMLVNAVQLLRAAGIHFIVCTQVPSKEVLSMRVRTNLSAKIAFSVADMAASMSILNNSDAFALGIPGRAVFRSRFQLVVQTPFISDEIVRETVKGATTGKFEDVAKRHDVTLEEMLSWGLYENAASLEFHELHKHFNPRGITQLEIKAMLQEAENKEYLIGSAMYRVVPGKGNRPRRLVAVTEDEGSNDGDKTS